MVLQDILVVPRQHHHGDGGTLVGSTLQIGQRLHEHQTAAHGTGAALQTLGVAVPEDHHHVVDGFLQWLAALGGFVVALGKGVYGNGQDFIDGCLL